MSMTKGHKVFFLDRDGTINVDHGYVHTIEQWQWTDRVIEGLQNLQQAGFKLVVITNQGGIDEGLYGESDMTRVHEYMSQELGKQGVYLANIQFCPHKREAGCECRKPKTGMPKQAEAVLGPIDYASSWFIGDKIADLECGKTLGTKTALVKSAYWKEEDLTERPDIIVESLYEASLAIRQNN